VRDFSRRGFLAALGAGAAAAACSDDEAARRRALERALASTTTIAPTSSTAPPAPVLPGNPFTLGVASGDPLPDRVVLWTRLAPDPANGGGMGTDDVAVIWEVGEDDTFATLAASGIATASARWAHSVHVDAGGLDPDTWYAYRFRVGPHVSPTGRTRTAPADDADPDQLRFGFASCQHWEEGYFNAWRDAAATALDVVLFLGDYIYEGGPQPLGPEIIRQHSSPEVTDLPGYRNRYALYKGDPDLQAAHRHCPWIVVWDDHEVDNDYAGVHSQQEAQGVTTEQFLARRAAAYQAWWEHMPVRLDPPDGPDLKIYRSFRWGNLASLFMLDTRQYRDDQPCSGSGLNTKPTCPEADDPARTITGSAQERWLLDGLDRSTAAWNVIGNQVVMTPIEVGGVVLNYDQWDGYRAERSRLLDHLLDKQILNTVVVTGDIHLAAVGDLVSHEGGQDTLIATELVGTSISSDPGLPAGVGDAVTAAVPDVEYFDAAHRGWCHCTVTADRWTAEFRTVADNRIANSPVSVGATFEIVPTEPGAKRV
jgi:alkaline phosphatase D